MHTHLLSMLLLLFQHGPEILYVVVGARVVHVIVVVAVVVRGTGATSL